MVWWVPLAVAGANAASSALGAKSQHRRDKRATAEQWQREDSSYQRTVADMEKAGLNKALMYGKGGGQLVGSTPPKPAPNTANAGAGVAQAMATAAQIKLANAQADKVKAETDRIKGGSVVDWSKIALQAAGTLGGAVGGKVLIDKLKKSGGKPDLSNPQGRKFYKVSESEYRKMAQKSNDLQDLKEQIRKQGKPNGSQIAQAAKRFAVRTRVPLLAAFAYVLYAIGKTNPNPPSYEDEYHD